MRLRLLEDWCRGMDVSPRKALLVAGIPPICTVAETEEAAGWFGADGRVRAAREDVPAG